LLLNSCLICLKFDFFLSKEFLPIILKIFFWFFFLLKILKKKILLRSIIVFPKKFWQKIFLRSCSKLEFWDEKKICFNLKFEEKLKKQAFCSWSFHPQNVLFLLFLRFWWKNKHFSSRLISNLKNFQGKWFLKI